MSSNTTTLNPLPDLFRQVAPDVEIPDPFDAPALRWGILGAGGIARTFARDVPAHSKQKVVAIGSRDKGRALAFAKEINLPVAGAYGSYEELVAAPDVDAVYVATPHMRHRDDALLALRAGKPVLVEKSFAMSVAQAQEVFDEAAASNLFAMEGMWSRHLPHYHFIRAAIESGRLGNVVEVSAEHGQQLLHIPRMIEPALGGGAMLDLGVYPLSLVQMVLGKPDEQSALGRLSDKRIDLGDVVIGKHGTGLSVATCQLDGASPTRGLLTLSSGIIEMAEVFYRPTKVKLVVGKIDPTMGAMVGSKEAEWDARVPGGFQYQAAEAARRIAAGDLQSPVVPWSATLEVQQMMNDALAQVGVSHPPH